MLRKLFTFLPILVCLSLCPAGMAGATCQTGWSQGNESKDDRLDILWSLLPEKVLSDQFGKRVSRQFYGIEVILGNDTGSDFLVAAFSFSKSESMTLTPASLSMVMALTSESKRGRLCEFGFDGDLVVRTNSQTRTLIFVPRQLLKSAGNRRDLDVAQLKDQLGELHIVARKIAAAK